jgi:hypothetical protein
MHRMKVTRISAILAPSYETSTRSGHLAPDEHLEMVTSDDPKGRDANISLCNDGNTLNVIDQRDKLCKESAHKLGKYQNGIRRGCDRDANHPRTVTTHQITMLT